MKPGNTSTNNASVLKKDVVDQAAILTINRPDVMNCVNRKLLDALNNEIDTISEDNRIRAIIITGAGEKAFCAGADLKERRGMSDSEVQAFVTDLRLTFSRLESLNKPVIAAINGVSFGAGTELALACDIRLCSENAVMGLTETRLAIIPGGGGTQRLPRLVGRGKAMEMIFTGKRIDAEKADEIGLVNRVCAQTALMAECREMAAEISETGPIAIEQAKYAIHHGLETDLQTGLAIESSAYRVVIPTRDRIEGLEAFREKRKPVYKGH